MAVMTGFCPNCGTPRGTGNFCAGCGANLSGLASTAQTQVKQPDEEREVWAGSPDPILAPIAANTTKYRVTTERVTVESGLLGKTNESIQLFRVKDVNVHKSLVQRARGVGDVELISTDVSDPHLRLEAVVNPDQLAEELRRLVQKARHEANVFMREGL